MFERLMRLFIDSSEAFITDEPALILSGVSERCLCGSFMLRLRGFLDKSEFRDYYCDIEYNRNFDGNIKTIIDDQHVVLDITCDLIVHSRGLNPDRDNLIAIEMKRDIHSPLAKDSDRKRIETF